jgi:hypothetical protein
MICGQEVPVPPAPAKRPHRTARTPDSRQAKMTSVSMQSVRSGLVPYIRARRVLELRSSPRLLNVGWSNTPYGHRPPRPAFHNLPQSMTPSRLSPSQRSSFAISLSRVPALRWEPRPRPLPTRGCVARLLSPKLPDTGPARPVLPSPLTRHVVMSILLMGSLSLSPP